MAHPQTAQEVDADHPHDVCGGVAQEGLVFVDAGIVEHVARVTYLAPDLFTR